VVEQSGTVRRIRVWLGVFVLGLVLSGVTAFPLVWETGLLVRIVARFGTGSAAYAWVSRVHDALVVTGQRFPFLAYGTDWLAFAHLVLAVVFIGPWREPARNKWVIQFGFIACAGVIPLALIAGAVRGIPLWWRLGDCCFGIFGTIPLWFALRDVRRLERDILQA
jgi:hypothetical protein